MKNFHNNNKNKKIIKKFTPFSAVSSRRKTFKNLKRPTMLCTVPYWTKSQQMSANVVPMY